MTYNQIHYSDKYYDSKFEYRHVILPKDLLVRIPKNGKLLSERQWRDLGICMSRGWVHYSYYKPEPNILMFKRKFKGNEKNPRTELEEKSRDFKKMRTKEKVGSENRK